MRKYLIVFILLFFAFQDVNANKVNLVGEITGLDNEVFYIYRFRNQELVPTDSVKIKNSRFKLHTNVLGTELVYFKVGEKTIGSFFIESGDIKLSGKASRLSDLELKGSKSQELHEKITDIKNTTSQLDREKTILFEKYYHEDSAYSQKLLAELKSWRISEQEKLQNLLLSNAKNGAAQFTFLTDFNSESNLDNIERFIARASDSGSIYLQELKEAVLFYKAISIGALAPDFELPDLNGELNKLSDYRGSYILLDFWASWCSPCRKANPEVLKVYDKFRNKGFQVVAVSLDNKNDAWEEAIKQDGIEEWHHLSDLIGWQSPTVQQYNIKGVPFSLLIDPDGYIVSKDLNAIELEKKLTVLLNEI